MYQEELFYRCHCLYMVEDETKIWFFCNKQKALCEIDKKTNEVKILAFIDRIALLHGFFLEDYSYAGIEKVNSKLVLVPRSAKKIVIYDLEEKELRYVNFAEADKERKQEYYEDWKFEKSFTYLNNVYMFPMTYPAIIVLDVYTERIIYLKEWIIEIEKNSINVPRSVYISDLYVNGIKVWLSCGICNLMICFDLIEWTFEYFKFPIHTVALGSFAYDGVNFWIVEYGKRYERVFKWNVITNMIKEFVLFESLKKVYSPIQSVLYFNNKLLFFPYINSNIYELDMKTEKIKVNEQLNQYIQETERFTDFQILCTKLLGNKLRFITGHNLMWHEFSEEKSLSYEIILKGEDREKQKCRLVQEFNYEKQDNIFNEKYLPLDLYLTGIYQM